MPIRLGNSRAGLDDIVPADHEILGFDDLGDPLALAPDGRVIAFQHDLGTRSVAFRTRAQFEEFVAFQGELTAPEGEDLAALRARKAKVAAFGKTMTGCPYAREELAEARRVLGEAIADRSWAESPKGRALAARHAFSAQCEAAMKAAGCDRPILARPDIDHDKGVMVFGDLSAPWTESRLLELLAPLAKTARLRLRFRSRPAAKPQ